MSNVSDLYFEEDGAGRIVPPAHPDVMMKRDLLGAINTTIDLAARAGAEGAAKSESTFEVVQRPSVSPGCEKLNEDWLIGPGYELQLTCWIIDLDPEASDDPQLSVMTFGREELLRIAEAASQFGGVTT